jgi:geranylgeranyl reductase family protein
VVIVVLSEFPSYPTCAGALIGASLASIPASVLETVEDRTVRAVFTRDGRTPVTIAAPDPFLGMVDRQRFDAALLDAAVGAGATFRGRLTVRDVRESAGEVELETSDGILRARFVIGADGSASRVARYVGVRYRSTDLGLEDEVAIQSGSPWHGTILVDWGAASGSYAWMFPKDTVAAVGVIQRTGSPEATRAFLTGWKGRLGLADEPSLHSTGHLTRWRQHDSPLRRGRVIVVGDAAGLLEPWLREGISFALRSGTWAGEAIAAGDPDAYVRRVLAELTPEMRSGELLLSLFERVPRLLHWALARPGPHRFFVRYGRNETTLARFWGPRWVMALAGLVLPVSRARGSRG